MGERQDSASSKVDTNANDAALINNKEAKKIEWLVPKSDRDEFMKRKAFANTKSVS